MREDNKDMRKENLELRQILCDCLAALNNGSGALPEASMQFMRDIPKEIKAVIAQSAADVEEWKNEQRNATLMNARNAVYNCRFPGMSEASELMNQNCLHMIDLLRRK